MDEVLDEALAGTFPASDPVSTLICEESAASTPVPGEPSSEQGEEKPDQQDVGE
jgi:hypothetical protein